MKKAMRVTGNILFYTVLVVAVVAALAFATSSDPKKSIGGYRFYEVLSGSMEPAIHKGSLVVIKVTPPEQLKVGDVATKAVTQDGSVTLTHRIKEITADEAGNPLFVTKGDNSPAADEPTGGSAMIGKVVWRAPYIGFGVKFVRENPLLAASLLLAVCVLAYCVRVLVQKPASTSEVSTSDVPLEEEQGRGDIAIRT